MNQDDNSVRLKPVWGIEPRIYIPIIYLFAAAVIFFAVFILPGLVNRGGFISISSCPSDAPVFMNGHEIGVTPCRVFAHPGVNQLVIEKPFYLPYPMKISMEDRVLATLFSPPGSAVSARLTIEDPEGLASSYWSDYTRYGMVADYSREYRLPPILTEACASIMAECSKPLELAKILEAFLRNALLYVDSDPEAKEWIKADALLRSNGKPFSPVAGLRLVRDLVSLKRENPGFADLLFFDGFRNGFFTELRKKIKRTGWFQEESVQKKKNIDSVKPVTAVSTAKPDLSFDEVVFHQIRPQPFDRGDRTTGTGSLLFPTVVLLEPFLISETEITNRQYSRFIRECPEWGPSGRESLTSRKLATSEYLVEWAEPVVPIRFPDFPVCQVSWHAAKAYCDWLSSMLKLGEKGQYARLPFETELEYLLSASSKDLKIRSLLDHPQDPYPQPAGYSPGDKYGVRDIWGNLWEWCDNWYFPSGWFYGIMEWRDDRVRGSEKSIRGGSWISGKDTIDSHTRACLPPDWCNRYTGFRVVIGNVK
jgi:gamma-glutamyl hercynylcysteine S-oxide synthase